MKRVAQVRSAQRSGYARRASHLKWANAGGRGQYTSKLSLGNATALREYYLSAAATKRTRDRRSRYADVVVFDLDPGDGLFLVIENKLFGANHKGQLLDELELVEERYLSVPIREYVYLTLSGERPVATTDREKAVLNRWVCLSWTGDVLGFLNERAENPSPRLAELIGLLRWLRALSRRPRRVRTTCAASRTHSWRPASTSSSSSSTVLAKAGRGSGRWTGPPMGPRSSSTWARRKRTLSISMLTNCSLVVQSKYRNRARCDKLLVPFGAPFDGPFDCADHSERCLQG